jgi:hypothetical protein
MEKNLAKGRPRKLHLSPLQGETLGVLAEAGAENLPALLNTLHTRFPEYSRDDLVAALEEVCRGLWRLGLVTFSKDYHRPHLHYVLADPEEVYQLLSIHSYVRFDEEANLWTWDEERGGPHPVSLVITQEGEEMLLR